jgi:transcriptional regulator with XRE-family HTH domain
MSKRKPIDNTQARERRNKLLESAAAAALSLTEGVREMRTIAGMTQEEFAKHRGVSARVIKAIELGQGNPTVATLNRIGQFFGLEVGFVPVRRAGPTEPVQPVTTGGISSADHLLEDDDFMKIVATVTRDVILNMELEQKKRPARSGDDSDDEPRQRKK